jgi:lipid-A-disaccharide synthase-like uncharacterized protein
MFIESIGIIGAVLIALSWIPETIRTIKTKKTGLDLEFVSVYVLGSIFLAIYSISIKDYIFIGLNIFASSLAIFNLIYTIKEKKQTKK